MNCIFCIIIVCRHQLNGHKCICRDLNITEQLIYHSNSVPKVKHALVMSYIFEVFFDGDA